MLLCRQALLTRAMELRAEQDDDRQGPGMGVDGDRRQQPEGELGEIIDR